MDLCIADGSNMGLPGGGLPANPRNWSISGAPCVLGVRVISIFFVYLDSLSPKLIIKKSDSWILG